MQVRYVGGTRSASVPHEFRQVTLFSEALTRDRSDDTPDRGEQYNVKDQKRRPRSAGAPSISALAVRLACIIIATRMLSVLS